ncbi:MAG TPA: four helix bundle protein, partial [Flavisolibacter sp.]|nr:four helix bundle protein [Flavisolibacter sp.]
KDTVQFLHIARGSLYELETLLLLAIQVEIVKHDSIDSLLLKVDKCKQVLNGLINYYEKSNLQ